LTDASTAPIAVVPIRAGSPSFHTAADRIWRAWWEGQGVSLADIEQRLAGVVGSTEGEFGLAATCGEAFAGVCLAIHSDLDERPNLSPWIAALWVEPEFRSRGIARRLVMDAIAQCAAQGTDIVYLCARAPLRKFYLAMGWRLLEEGVGGDQLDVFQMHTTGTMRE